MTEETGIAPPREIEALAASRAVARRSRDFAAADRLKAEIEAAGWKVVDSGVDWHLTPARPPDRVVDGRTLHGSSATVPSRLDEPATVGVTVVLVLDSTGEARRTIASVVGAARGDAQVVVVDDGEAPGPSALDGAPDGPEVVRTDGPLGPGAAANSGIRRATGDTVVLLGGDGLQGAAGPGIVTRLVAALDDPSVAVTGTRGLTSGDLRRFSPAPAGPVDALDWGCIAFRRADYAERGPLDERFDVPHLLSIWWSLVLRDEGEGEVPRTAFAVDDPPPGAAAERGPSRHADGATALRDRTEKRDFYRIIDRFATRRDLLIAPAPRRTRRH